MVALAFNCGSGYSFSVPEKEGNRRGNLNITEAHKPRNAVFLRAYVIASFLWVAVAGGFGLLGSFVSSFQPVTCHPPHLEMGGGLTTTQRSQIMTRAELYRCMKLGYAFANNSKPHIEAPEKQFALHERIIAFNLDPVSGKPRLSLIKAGNRVGAHHVY